MWKLSENKEWQYLTERFNWVEDMHGVPQDPHHHAEGDVAIHTQMVIAELLKTEFYQNTDKQTQEILWTSALMHDIEKRSTTVIEADGRIGSPNHAKKGEMTTRQILYKDIQTPFDTREKIAKIVRYHGLPLWVFHKPNPIKAIIQASLEVELPLLACIAEADVKGRICEDKEDLLYRIEMFRELAKEQDCWDKAKVFPSNLAKFEYFQKEDSFPDYQPFDNTNNEVIMLSGLPGAGKDTYIKNNLKDWKIVSLDAIRREMKISPTDSSGNGKVIQVAKERAKVYLREKTSFIWNATNITKSLRMPLIELFASYGAKVKIIYLEVPYNKLMSQNADREHIVPENVIHKLIQKLEIPTLSEVHELIYEVK